MTAFQGTLRKGDSGSGVQTLERHLIRDDTNALENVELVGLFNLALEEAVINFQSKHSDLAVDGIAGPSTQARLISVNSYSPGQQGRGVEMLQLALNRFTIDCDVDGSYGPETTNAVRMFQQHNSIQADGYAGVVTFDTLDKALNFTQVKRGDNGTIFSSVVRGVQAALVELGEDIAIDGDFGPATEDAVKKAQAEMGLPQTGVADGETFGYLYAVQVSSKLTDADIELIVEDQEKFDLLFDYLEPDYDDADPYAEATFNKEKARADGLSDSLIEELEEAAQSLNDYISNMAPLMEMLNDRNCDGTRGITEGNSWGPYQAYYLNIDTCDTAQLKSHFENLQKAAAGGFGSSFIKFVQRVVPQARTISAIAYAIGTLGYWAIDIADKDGNCGIKFHIAANTVTPSQSFPYWVSSQC